MNYGQPPMRNVTMINDLPDVSELEQGGQYGNRNLSPVTHDGYRRAAYNLIQNPHVGGNLPPEAAEKYSRMIRQRPSMMPEAGMSSYQQQQNQESPQTTERIVENMTMPVNNPLTGISCLDIASHVNDCPICSKFYNNDKTVYILVIVVLVIVCLLLLKRVLDV